MATRVSPPDLSFFSLPSPCPSPSSSPSPQGPFDTMLVGGDEDEVTSIKSATMATRVSPPDLSFFSLPSPCPSPSSSPSPQGPFDTMLVGGDEDEVTSIKFSNDGNQILVCTLNGRIYLLDAFEGQKQQLSALSTAVSTCSTHSMARRFVSPAIVRSTGRMGESGRFNFIPVCTLNGRIYLLDAFEVHKCPPSLHVPILLPSLPCSVPPSPPSPPSLAPRLSPSHDQLHTLCVIHNTDGAPFEASLVPSLSACLHPPSSIPPSLAPPLPPTTSYTLFVSYQILTEPRWKPLSAQMQNTLYQIPVCRPLICSLLGLFLISLFHIMSLRLFTLDTMCFRSPMMAMTCTSTQLLLSALCYLPPPPSSLPPGLCSLFSSLLSGSGDGTVKAWSATTGAQVGSSSSPPSPMAVPPSSIFLFVRTHSHMQAHMRYHRRPLMAHVYTFPLPSALLPSCLCVIYRALSPLPSSYPCVSPLFLLVLPCHEKTLFFFTIGDFSEGNSRLPPLTRTLEFLVTELIFTPDSTSIFSFASALHGFLANLEELPGQRHSDASREARRVRGGGAGRDFSSHVNSSSWATVHRCCASTSSSAASRMRQRALSTHPGSHANAASAQPHRQPLLRQMRQIARLGAAKLARRVCLEASLAENTHLSYAPQSPPQSSHEPSEAVESDTDRKTSDARASLDHVDCFMRPLSHRAILSLIELCDELRELELSNPVSKISEAPGTSKAGIEQPRAKGSKTLSWLLLNETPCAIPLDAAPATVLLLGVDRLRRHGAPQSMSSPDSTKSVQAGVASATDAKTSRDRVKEEGGTLESIEE
ncbi:unnamed protein product [Closterium sp. NIES-54]